MNNTEFHVFRDRFKRDKWRVFTVANGNKVKVLPTRYASQEAAQKAVRKHQPTGEMK